MSDLMATNTSNSALNGAQSEYLQNLMNEYQATKKNEDSTYVMREPKQELGKDEFMELLIAQMKYQDPLEPMDNKEFIAQTAQFSSLEQMLNLNNTFSDFSSTQSESMNALAASLSDFTRMSQVGNSLDFIGRDVQLQSNTLAVEDGIVPLQVVGVCLEPQETFIEITDDEGNIVRRESLGTKAEGELFEYSWDANNNSGSKVGDGQYSARLYTQGNAGAQNDMETLIVGHVGSVKFDETQGAMVRLGTSYFVPVSEIKEIF